MVGSATPVVEVHDDPLNTADGPVVADPKAREGSRGYGGALSRGVTRSQSGASVDVVMHHGYTVENGIGKVRANNLLCAVGPILE